MHLAAAGQVVADNGLVISIERVGVLCFYQYLVGLQEALHPRVPLVLILRVQLVDCLLVETRQQTHELLIFLHGVLVA